MTGNAGRVLRPDHFADQLTSVSLDELAAAGIRGLIVDLEPAAAAWIAAALARDFKVCLVSNNFTGRVMQIAAELGVPAVPSALKPLPGAFLKALALLGTPKGRTLVVGDQLFTDVLGARLAGMGSILTRPLVAKDWMGTRILRLLERLVLGKRPPSGVLP
jgi:uncharacterized protein